MSESFLPDLLRPLLQPLAAAGDESPQIRAYRRYYGLDLGERRPGVQGRLGCFNVGPYRIVAQVWWPERPRATLLLLHGYYDHMGLYRHVLDWALGMGFAVLSCDLPGHGLSSGAPASIDDFAEYQAVFQGLLAEAAALDLPKPWHLFGQSTGGAILLDYLLTGAPRPELGETILFAPWCGRAAGPCRSSATRRCGRSSRRSRGASPTTPAIRPSSSSFSAIRCRRASCRPPGSAHWRAGFRGSRVPSVASAVR
ncbi:alpha/beta hydrolase [Azotobacter sp. CWF10]